MWLSCLKLSCLFIGALIGAGFATGAEIELYFSECGILTPIIAGGIIGVLCIIFGLSGKFLIKKGVLNKIYKGMIFVSSVISYIAMTAGAESIIYECFSIKYVGLITAVIVSILSMYSMNVTKWLNMVIVPVILILMFVVEAGCTEVRYPTKIGIITAISYAGMNMLLGGYLMAEEGRKMKTSAVIVSGIIVAVFITVMLIVMYRIVIGAKGGQMPMYDVANGIGLGIVAAIIIFLAIFSTIIGAGKVICDMIADVTKDKWMGVGFLLLITALSYNAGFGYIVNNFYPFTGFIGIVACAAVCIIWGVHNALPHSLHNKLLYKFNDKIHRSGKNT